MYSLCHFFFSSLPHVGRGDDHIAMLLHRSPTKPTHTEKKKKMLNQILLWVCDGTSNVISLVFVVKNFLISYYFNYTSFLFFFLFFFSGGLLDEYISTLPREENLIDYSVFLLVSRGKKKKENKKNSFMRL